MTPLARDLRSAALVSSMLVLPLMILESMNQTLTRQNAPGLVVLFGLLWLLPAVFLVVILPIVRNIRAGYEMARPVRVLLGVAFAVVVALLWGSILVDQMPCLLGVPNCD